MTPSWLEAHASYINSYRSSTAEQLTFNTSSVGQVSLLKVPIIPANVLETSTMLTVRIVVSNDVSFGTNGNCRIRYGLSDGISFVGFTTTAKKSYSRVAPCFGMEGSSGGNLTGQRAYKFSSPRSKNFFYPGQFFFTFKLDVHESWGSCYTAQNGGYAKTALYNKRLDLNRGLTLEVYEALREQRVGVKFIEVTVVDDL